MERIIMYKHKDGSIFPTKKKYKKYCKLFDEIEIIINKIEHIDNDFSRGYIKLNDFKKYYLGYEITLLKITNRYFKKSNDEYSKKIIKQYVPRTGAKINRFFSNDTIIQWIISKKVNCLILAWGKIIYFNSVFKYGKL